MPPVVQRDIAPSVGHESARRDADSCWLIPVDAQAVYSTTFDRTATTPRDGWGALCFGGIMDASSYARAVSRGRYLHMTSALSSSSARRAACVLFICGALAACQKNDSSPGQVAGKLNDAAQAAGQKLDQAASYVNQQVDATKSAAQQNLEAASAPSIKIDPAALASTAQANLQNAASAANAQLGKAASITGQGLETAGRKLQAWSAQNSASSTSAGASTSSADSSDAQKQMDK